MLLTTTLNKVGYTLLQQCKKPAFITAVCAIVIMLGLSASARSQEVVAETTQEQEVEVVEVKSLRATMTGSLNKNMNNLSVNATF
jgi:ABC-type molybdate transport system substrate-binding protein